MSNILNPEFKYNNSVSTDIRATFARARREQAGPALIIAQDLRSINHGHLAVRDFLTVRTGESK